MNVQQRIESDGTDSSSSSADASSDSSDSSSSDASSATGLGSKTYTVDYTGYKTALFNDIFNVSAEKKHYLPKWKLLNCSFYFVFQLLDSNQHIARSKHIVK